MIVSLLKQQLSKKLTANLLSKWNNVQRTRSFCQSSIDVNTNVVKDVILYKYDKPKFFKIVNIFALCQFGFWSYLSYTTFTEMRSVPVPKSDRTNENLPWWRKINLGEEKYKYTLGTVSFIIGYGILAVAWIYTLRSVRYLVLRKGGQEVSFVTYTPIGPNRILTVDLNHVNCPQSRSNSSSTLPIKVQNHYLYYLLDMKGEFRNPLLFDHTAGMKRQFKKV